MTAAELPANIRPVSNAVLMSCRTKFIIKVRLWHGGSTVFETILELGSTLPCSTASPVVLHVDLSDFNETWTKSLSFIRAPNVRGFCENRNIFPVTSP